MDPNVIPNARRRSRTFPVGLRRNRTALARGLTFKVVGCRLVPIALFSHNYRTQPRMAVLQECPLESGHGRPEAGSTDCWQADALVTTAGCQRRDRNVDRPCTSENRLARRTGRQFA